MIKICVRVARAVVLAGLVSLIVALIACQAAPTPAPAVNSAFPTAPTAPNLAPPGGPLQTTPLQGTPGKVLNLTGNFAYVGNDGNLSIVDAGTGAVRVLVPTDVQGYAQYPAFSPDGKQVAYSYSSFTKDGNVQAQIRVINLDGSNDRVLVSPADIRIVVDLAAWGPDGKSLYVTQISPVEPSSQRSDVYRVSSEGGTLTKVIDGGFEASVSPDGNKIVYQKVDFSTYAASLWISNIDGSGAKQLADDQTFTAMFGPRFSPDSQNIVFAVSGPAKKKLPGLQAFNSRSGTVAQQAASQAGGCLFSFARARVGLDTAEAHGLPWDLYMVNLDGTKFERLTQIGADSPVPVWSKDGKFIAFFEGTGIYMLDRDKNALYTITHTGGYGGFDWR